MVWCLKGAATRRTYRNSQLLVKLRYDLVGTERRGKKVKKNVVILNAYLGARLRGFRPEKQKNISFNILFLPRRCIFFKQNVSNTNETKFRLNLIC